MSKPIRSWSPVARASALALLALPLFASTAYAADPPAQKPGEPAADAPPDSGLGLEPGTPVVGTLPGGMGPAYGAKPQDEQSYQFDYHGMITMPLRVGLNARAGVVTTEQKNLVIHAPPVVPDYPDSPGYTGVVPQPYAQLAFSYGNSIVTGTAIIKAWTATTATSFFDPTLQGGITDAFVTFNLPNLVKNAHLAINVGAFSNRYGTMGEYDEGHYATPIIGRTNGVGENIIARYAIGDVVLAFEQGFQAQLDKTPVGLTSDGWNGFADPNTGTGLVMHEHLGLTYRRQLTAGLHYMRAWSQDDRAAQSFTPDGSVSVLGADVRMSASHLGHAYLGASYTIADNARTVGRILSVMNTQGGLDLMRNYLGNDSGGNGKILTIGGEYGVSLARLLLYPRDFDGKARDIVLSVFGMYSHIQSKDKTFDKDNKVKFGGEGTYALFSWMAGSLRLDHVRPTSNVAGREFTIVSPRIIFRTDWQARNQIVLQYSRFFYGSSPVVRSGYPAVDDFTLKPDKDMISLSASTWW